MEISSQMLYKSLLQNKNKVSIEILYYEAITYIDVEFKNVKKVFNPLEEIANASFYDLIGIDYDWRNDIKRLKRDYRLFQLSIHEDKLPIFFESWYGKIKKNISCEKFDKIYTALSFKIFKILKDDVKEVEAVLKDLSNYDNKILTENKVINKFKQLLLEVNKLVNAKKRNEEVEWRNLNK